MRLIIKGRHIKLSEAEKDFIEEKMEKVDPFLGRFTKLEIEVNDIRGGNKGGVDKRVEATTKSYGKVIRIEETSESVRDAVNLLQEKLVRTLRKRKEKVIDKRREKIRKIKRMLPGRWFEK